MQVTRNRRAEKEDFVLLGRRFGRRATLVTACVTAVGLAATGTAFAQTHQFGTQQVGQTTSRGQVVSSDQYIAPYGDRTVINDGKIMSSSVSPDGTHLAATVTDGGAALNIVDLKSWTVKQVVGNTAT